MTSFTPEFHDRDDAQVIPLQNITWTVEPFSARFIGGSDVAKVTAMGSLETLWTLLGWLRYGLKIRNGMGTCCWYGYIEEVEIVAGAVTLAISLDKMANRVAVRYSYALAGVQVADVTSWAQDDFSVATFGTKERIDTAADCRPATAEAFRDALLAALALPPAPPPSIADPAAQASATLYGKGWIHTLGWKFYEQPVGRIVQNAGGKEQVLGWGITAPLGFKSKRIYELDGKWAGLPTGVTLEISGLAANNGTYLVDEVTSDAAVTLMSATVYFESANDILDTAFALDFIRAKEMIHITGSAANSGYHVVSGANSQHVTTDTTFGGTIADEAAGSVTLVQGNHIHVTSAVTNADPGTSATVVVHGMKVAQKFTPPVAGTFTPGEIVIRARKVGSPSDGLKVSLQSDAAGSPSGTILDDATLAGADIGTDMGGLQYAFNRTASLVYGTDYHLVVERTGSNSHTDYYVLDVDEKLSYGASTLTLWTGSSWVARAPDANLYFEIWGHQETTMQMVDIATAAGQFGLDVTVQQASGIYDRQYRAGDYAALSELEDLLNRGASGGQRLIALMWPGTRSLNIQAEPVSSTTTNLLLRSDGRFYWPSGAPLEPGVLPVGQWVTLADVPPAANSVVRVSPVFMAACEYDPRTGRIRPTQTRGAAGLYELAKTKSGAELFKAMKPLIVGGQ